MPRPQGLACAERLRAEGVPARSLDLQGLDNAFLAWGSFARAPRDGMIAQLLEETHG